MLPPPATPTGGTEQGGLCNVKCTPEEHIILTAWLRAHRASTQAQRTQTARTSTKIPPDTTPNCISGGNVTSADVEAVLKRIPFVDEIFTPLKTASQLISSLRGQCQVRLTLVS